MIQVKKFVCLSFSFLSKFFAKFWASLLIQSLDLKISLPLILFLSELWRFWFCTLILSFCCHPEIVVILLLSNHLRVLRFEPVEIDFKIKTKRFKFFEKKYFFLRKNTFPSISYYFHIPKFFDYFFPHTRKNRNRRKSNLLP